MKKFQGLIIALAMTMMVATFSGCSSGSAGSQGPAGAQGPSGVSVSTAVVNASGHLVITLSNGQTIDAGVVIGPQGAQGPSSTGTASSFANLVPQIEPSIVRIDVTVPGGLDSGSGTIVDSRGYILTNAHVVTGGQSIKVTLKDGTVLAATVVGSDTNLDMAIIKLTSTLTNFPVMSRGTLADVVVGADVMAVGFPLGTDLPGPATFTKGIISAIRVDSGPGGDGQTYIQTDTPINPGNSGGCLFTPTGKMIGIPSAAIVPAGDFEDINLVIPMDRVNTFIALWVK